MSVPEELGWIAGDRVVVVRDAVVRPGLGVDGVDEGGVADAGRAV